MAAASGSARRISGLDAVRFAAALMVVATHFGTRSGGYIFPWGGNGVSLFFVLSGYLLWLPFVHGRPNLFSYALSRAARLLPAYAAAAIILTALVGGSLVQTLTMTQTSPIPVVWTLQAEVAFYLAVPFLAMFRRPLLVPIVLGCLSLGLELAIAWTPAHGGPTESLLPVRFWAFAPGMVLAAVQPRTDWRWLVAGAASMCVGAAFLVNMPGTEGGQWTDIPSTIGAGLIVGWGIHASPPGRRFWAAGAAISYGLYIWHVDLIDTFGYVGLPLAFVAASLSYVLLERPVLRWARRRNALRVPAVAVQGRETAKVPGPGWPDGLGGPSSNGTLAERVPVD